MFFLMPTADFTNLALSIKLSTDIYKLHFTSYAKIFFTSFQVCHVYRFFSVLGFFLFNFMPVAMHSFIDKSNFYREKTPSLCFLVGLLSSPPIYKSLFRALGKFCELEGEVYSKPRISFA